MRALLMCPYVLGAACLLAAPAALAGPADTLWTRVYGGPERDLCASARQTEDGGYLAAGSTNSFGAGGFDVYLVRTDARGDTLWTRTYGGGHDEHGASMELTEDGGCLVVGYTKSFRPDTSNVYVVRVGANGDTLWTRTYGTGAFNSGSAVARAPDGGYLIAGTTGSDLFAGLRMTDEYLVKISADGDSLWTRRYDTPDIEIVGDICPTGDGCYVVAGSTLDTLSYLISGYLMKIDAQGNSLWMASFTDQSACMGSASSVIEAPDGGYVVAGSSCLRGFDVGDMGLVKTKSTGWPLWARNYIRPGIEAAHAIAECADGGYILAGERWSSPISADFYVVLTNSEGDTIWTATWGGPGIDQAYSVKQTSDGGYIIAGTCEFMGPGKSDFWLVKTVGLPPDTTAPGLEVGILQNPYLTRYLDICLVGSERLDSASVEVSVNDESVAMRQSDKGQEVWIGDYKLPVDGGAVSVEARVEDLAGNDTTVTASFSALHLAGADDHFSSPDGKVTLTLDGTAGRAGGYFIILPCATGYADERGSSVSSGVGSPVFLAVNGAPPTGYRICPDGEIGGSGAWLEFSYDQCDPALNRNPDRLYIEQGEVGRLQSYFDPERGSVGARLGKTGTFRLGLGPPGTSGQIDRDLLALHAARPNPFVDGTCLCFDLGSRQHVAIEVFDASGRLVAVPWRGILFPGMQEVGWDGTSTGGDHVATGLYFVRVTGERYRTAGKVIKMR